MSKKEIKAFIICVLFLIACNEEKESDSLSSTRSNSFDNGWTIAGNENEYVLGDKISLRISSPNPIPDTEVQEARLELYEVSASRYEEITSSTSLIFDDFYAFRLGVCTVRGVLLTKYKEEIITQECSFRVYGPK